MDAATRLASRVKAAAAGVGFPLCGIAPAEPPPHHEFLLTWLQRGYGGEMLWLGRDPARRADPRRVLDGARSVIMVGAPYDPPQDPIDAMRGVADARGVAEPRGVVSSYARGDDYHRLIEERLARLVPLVEQAVGEELAGAVADRDRVRAAILPGGTFSAKSYVDHGPLLERPLAARAGLGWIGKNTLLLHRRYGSWFFLGGLVTTLSLPADREERDHCGSCRRCLDACPTGAFPGPWVLDARRCISYLTIELRSSIPRELRAAMGTRVFGCDDCQTVCPWTGERPGEPLFPPREDLAAPSLAALIDMSSAEFETRFGATAIERARRRGLRRNALVALGNSGAEDSLPVMERALADDDAMIRGHAVWAIGRIARRAPSPEAAVAGIGILTAAHDREGDPAAREEIAAALHDAATEEAARTPEP